MGDDDVVVAEVWVVAVKGGVVCQGVLNVVGSLGMVCEFVSNRLYLSAPQRKYLQVTQADLRLLTANQQCPTSKNAASSSSPHRSHERTSGLRATAS